MLQLLPEPLRGHCLATLEVERSSNELVEVRLDLDAMPKLVVAGRWGTVTVAGAERVTRELADPNKRMPRRVGGNSRPGVVMCLRQCSHFVQASPTHMVWLWVYPGVLMDTSMDTHMPKCTV